VAPLRLGGLRGKQSTPSVGWEVPVRSRRSASGSDTERVDVIRRGRSGKGTLMICRVESTRIMISPACVMVILRE
jgi:hypothetical protein